MSFTKSFCRSGTPALFALIVLAALGGCAGVPRETPPGGNDIVEPTTAAVADQEIALFQHALASLNGADLDRAAAEFNALTKSRPGLAGPWVNLALVDIKKNDLPAAEQNITRALAQNPRMPQAYNVLGFIEVAKGNMAAAVTHYRKAIALKGDYALAYFNMALLHDIYLHDIPTAVQNYKRYLELTGNQDKKTADWLAELERTMARAKP